MEKTLPGSDRLPGGQRCGVAHVLAFAGVLLLAGFLRFSRLTERELWIDESCSFYVAHHWADWPANGPEFRTEVAHLPYFAALHAWTRWAGENAWGLRSFSAFAGILAVAAVSIVAWRLDGRRAGLCAGLLAAVHPLHVHYSQEARAYALWTVLVALTWGALYRAARTNRAGHWFGYGAAMSVAMLVHYHTLFLLPAGVAGVFVARDRQAFWKAFLATHLLLLVALLPVVLFLIAPFSSGGPRPWLERTWASYPPATAILRSLWCLLPSGEYPSYLGRLPGAAQIAGEELGAWAAALCRWGPATAVVMLIAAMPWHPRPAEDGRIGEDCSATSAEPGELRVLLYCAATIALNLAALWTYSVLVRPAYIVGRYDLACFAPLTVGLGILSAHARQAAVASRGRLPFTSRGDVKGQSARTKVRGSVRATAFFVLLASAGITLWGGWSRPPVNDLTQRAQRVATNLGQEDLLVCLGMYRWFLTYEWHRLDFSVETLSFPSNHDRQLCWSDARAETTDGVRLGADAREVVSGIQGALRAGRRVWLLAQGGEDADRLAVDRAFFKALMRANVRVEVRDDWLGLAELTAAPAGSSHAPSRADEDSPPP